MRKANNQQKSKKIHEFANKIIKIAPYEFEPYMYKFSDYLKHGKTEKALKLINYYQKALKHYGIISVDTTSSFFSSTHNQITSDTNAYYFIALLPNNKISKAQQLLEKHKKNINVMTIVSLANVAKIGKCKNTLTKIPKKLFIDNLK
ncbi:hypothetical protein LJT99_08680 [Lentisphaerae bacterium WC36]|nr:hypothetical protein LJT99_08680 [Lentisphaerae bacterium WC36]